MLCGMASTTTEDVVKAATDLGQRIAEHPAASRYAEVLSALEADVEAQRLMSDYARHVQMLQAKESQQQPIEVAEKQRHTDLQTQVAQHPVLRDLQMAQMDYVDLMRKVEQTISSTSGLTGGPG